MKDSQKPSDYVLAILANVVIAVLAAAWISGSLLRYLAEAMDWFGSVICSQSYKLAMMTQASQPVVNE
jgi:hypothetical protein